DLDAEGAEPPEAVDDVLRILARLVDRDRVDLLAKEALQLVVELAELGPFLLHDGEGVNVVEQEVPEEQLAEEGSPGPGLLAGFLRDLPRLLLARRSDIGHCHGTPPGLKFTGITAAPPETNPARRRRHLRARGAPLPPARRRAAGAATRRDRSRARWRRRGRGPGPRGTPPGPSRPSSPPGDGPRRGRAGGRRPGRSSHPEPPPASLPGRIRGRRHSRARPRAASASCGDSRRPSV